MSQNRDGLDPSKSVYEEISQGLETLTLGDREVRSGPQCIKQSPATDQSVAARIGTNYSRFDAFEFDPFGVIINTIDVFKDRGESYIAGCVYASHVQVNVGAYACVRVDFQLTRHDAGEACREALRWRAPIHIISVGAFFGDEYSIHFILSEEAFGPCEREMIKCCFSPI